MKNKTVIILLSVLAVLLYTVAVINFSIGDVLSGIGEVFMASTNALMAYSLYHLGQVAHLTSITAKNLAEFVETLSEGVHAILTIKGNKGTLELNPDDDPDDDPDDNTQGDDADRAE
jgi:hypothetical protein